MELLREPPPSLEEQCAQSRQRSNGLQDGCPNTDCDVNVIKQVAQRATIAHLSPMCQHPFISNKPASKVIKNLNSFQIREQLFFQGLLPPMSAV